MFNLKKVILTDIERWELMVSDGLSPHDFVTPALGKDVLIDMAFIHLFPETAPVIQAFTEAQEKIRDIIGPDHFFHVPKALHISILSHAYHLSAPDKSTLPPDFLLNRLDHTVHFIEDATDHLYPVVREQSILPIVFARLIATKHSVVAVAYDSTETNALRYRMCQAGIEHGLYPADRLNALYPNIIHTTLTLFEHQISSQDRKAINDLRPFGPGIPHQIEEISFVHLSHYYDVLNGSVIDTINLKK